ncbi:hypothetical protein L6164_000752 [Bauhinia variegata]|uniref:Uncharacterized protein n=1 Tax=Bauhinia variegata TaxID=167791 RepID=A0ACB9Q7I8_BAUVA|nr:hypothetical protein L6164_000752 [Bauhinia variegata]
MPSFPEKLECPELQLLVRDNAGSYQQMPDSFFEETRNLKVLDIGGMDCTPKPPTSLGFLKNLTVLYLFNCKCEDIAMVGELINLQILGFYRSILRELPREIGNLHQLSLLALDNCKNLEVIPCNVISNLTSLEELRVGSFVNWEVEVEGKTNVSLNEVGELKPHLTYIDLYVPDVKPLGALVLSGGAEFSELRFLTIQSLPALISFISSEAKQIDEGGNPSTFPVPLLNEKVSFPKLGTLIISEIVSSTTMWNQKVIANSFCKLRRVEIRYCEKLVTIFPAIIVRNLHDLKTLIVSNCNSLEVIFELQELNDKLSSIGKRIQLESLSLVQLPKLKQIWNNPYLQGTFNFKNLEQVYVEDCPMLSYVFPSSLANDLRQGKDLITIQNSPTTDPFEQKGGN